jgi:hypothetical protein
VTAKRRLRLFIVLMAAFLPATDALAASTTSDKGYTVDPCYKQCSPLLGSVTPRKEAQRVYKNCFALCSQRGVLICPHGQIVRYNQRCP